MSKTSVQRRMRLRATSGSQHPALAVASWIQRGDDGAGIMSIYTTKVRWLAPAAILALVSCDAPSTYEQRQQPEQMVVLNCQGDHPLIRDLAPNLAPQQVSYAFYPDGNKIWIYSEQEHDWVEICSEVNCSVEISPAIIRLKRGYINQKTDLWIDLKTGAWSRYPNGTCEVANPAEPSPAASEIAPSLPAASSSFKRVNLPRGVSLDVPKGWWVLDDEFTQMLNTSTEAVMDLTGISLQEGAETDLMRANSIPRSTFAAVAVTSMVPPSGQPDELSALGSAELSELAGHVKSVLGNALAKQGWQLLSEVSLQVSSVSGYPALISEYRRTGPKGPVSVQVIQIMTKRQEVKITLSFREAEAAIWSPVIEKIRLSIMVNEHASGNSTF